MNDQNPENQGHPAYKELLDMIPDEGLQQLLVPKLEEWDKKQQDKVQSVREEFAPYSSLKENNISEDEVKQALWMVSQLNSDPKSFVEQAIQHLNLDFVPKGQQVSSVTDPEEDEYEDSDLAQLQNHPAFKQLQQQAQELQEWRNQQQEEIQNSQQLSQWEKYLDDLTETKGDFDKVYVTALAQNGMSAEDAIDHYHNMVADQVKKAMEAQGGNPNGDAPKPPVVMGGNAGTGTGIPSNDIRMGDLSKDATINLAMDWLAKQQASENT